MRVLYFCQLYQDACQEAALLHSQGVIPILVSSVAQVEDHIKLQRPDLLVLNGIKNGTMLFDLMALEGLTPDQLVGVISEENQRLHALFRAVGISKFIHKPITTADAVNQILNFLHLPILKDARCRVQCDAWLQTSQGLAKSTVIDLSSNGICISTQLPLMVDHFYIMQVDLDGMPIRSTVRVVWKHRLLKGCSFEMMEHKERSHLVSYLLRNRQELQVVGY